MTDPPAAPRLVLTTNIPTPYRLAFFQVLADVATLRGIVFEVLFYARTEPNRHWQVNLEGQSYSWKILPGIHPAARGIYPHFNPTLPWELRRRRPTWVLIAGAWNTPSSLMAASRTLSGPGYRLLWSEGHAAAVRNPSGPIARARRAFWNRADGFAVPNDASRQFVHDELGRPAPCLRLPNTVDESFYLRGPATGRLHLREQLGLTESDVVVLCVAELADRKGVAELAQSAALLSEENRRRALFVFAGEGPLRGQLEQSVSGGRRRLLGHLDQGSVRDWLHASDLFVLPSKIDPNPLSAIEAALCGIPLVMSARAGNAVDLVGDHGTGWLLPSIEPGAIAAVLDQAIAVPAEERLAMGARARELARTHFSRESVAHRFLDDLLREFPVR